MWRWLLVRIPLALITAVVVLWLLLPWPVLLRWADPASTSLMRHRVTEAWSGGEDLPIRREWVPIERISPHLRRAVVAAEDGRFYRHEGIDWRALAEELRWEGDGDFSPFDGDDLRAVAAAVEYYRDNRSRVRGRSTITQQLAKNLYYTPERSLPRKIQEFFVARRLERFLEKERILEVYLNVVEWGPGVFGAEAAARHYYGRSAAELSLQQAASLAATLPHPLTSNPDRNPGRMARRRSLILSWIRESRDVPEQEMPEPPRIPRPEELDLDLVEPELDDDAPPEPPAGADPADTAGGPPIDEPVEPPPDDEGTGEGGGDPPDGEGPSDGEDRSDDPTGSDDATGSDEATGSDDATDGDATGGGEPEGGGDPPRDTVRPTEAVHPQPGT